jgi:LacI family transcriptional regulator
MTMERKDAKTAKPRRVALMIELDWVVKYLVKTYAGCQKYAAEVGWDCTIHPFIDHISKRSPGQQTYDGILGRVGPEATDDVRNTGVPVVNVRINSPVGVFPSVFPDFHEAGVMAAKHLMARGFRQFAFLGYAHDKSSQLELNGLRSAIAPSGLPCTVFRFPITSPTRKRTWGGFISDLGAWIDTWTTPIGVYGVHDVPCRYLMDLCQSKGLHLGRDVAVIGTGNENAICDSPAPSLTSVDLGYSQVGYQAAAMLDRLMDGESPPDEPLLIPPAALIPRESTDSYAVDDAVVARALLFIAEHSHESITVDDVAAATPTTRRSLERRFAKVMRRTISDEILRLRLERAKRRLVETDEPLKYVSAASGFSGRRSFDRAFIRSEGVSPSKYRKQRRAEN